MTRTDEIRYKRAQWLQFIAGKLDTRGTQRALGLADDAELELSTPEIALLTLHTGLSHILGHHTRDIAINGWLREEQATRLIANVWRTGEIDPNVSQALAIHWSSIYCVGRDTQTVRTDLLEHLHRSPVRDWVAQQMSADLDPDTVDLRFETIASGREDIDRAIEALAEYPTSETLDMPESHIPFLRVLILSKVVTLEDGSVTALEKLACYPDSPEEQRLALSLARTREFQFVDMSMPGSWPGPAPADVPGWVREAVIARGARTYPSSSGHVPGWLLVAESEDEVAAFRRWIYQPGFTLQTEAQRVSLGMALKFANDEHAYAEYYYQTDDIVDLIQLETLLAIGLVRVDLYQITSGSVLEYVDSFGSPLPEEIVTGCLELIAEMTATTEPTLHLTIEPGEQTLATMAIIDRTNFESLQLCQSTLTVDPTSSLANSYRHYLTVTHSCAIESARGVAPSVVQYQEAYQELRTEISRFKRSHLVPLDPALLGPSRAYIQFRVSAEDNYLHTFIAFVDTAGAPRTTRPEFSMEIRLTELPEDREELTEVLTIGLASLGELMEQGIRAVVVNPAPTIYHLPFHEALLRLGFSEASYSHRLSSLAMRERPEAHGSSISGWANTKADFLPTVEIELAAIRSLYEGSEQELDLDAPLPSVVHIAGHATTGSAPFNVGLAHAEGDWLTPSLVLRDANAHSTGVVVLSACNTGSAEFRINQIMENVPLDVAFIEAGARAVISTAAPVNDIIACVFSCALHFAIAHQSNTWSAYEFAKRCLTEPVEKEFASWLTPFWPDWRRRLQAAQSQAPNDWILFRLAGRYW